MMTFDLENKIYAAWDEDHSVQWNQYDAYDAGPDGLSGNKEGFYFANLLMPFTALLIFNGAFITPGNYPGCIDKDPFPCNTCQFFKSTTCQLLSDQSNVELSRKGFMLYQKILYCPKGGYDDIFDAAQKVLLSHGRPLHYHVLSKILVDRYPNLHITDHKVNKILRLNPIFYRMVDNGVFKALPGVKKSEETAESLYWKSLFDEL
jgi:hypothetical protein